MGVAQIENLGEGTCPWCPPPPSPVSMPMHMTALNADHDFALRKCMKPLPMKTACTYM